MPYALTIAVITAIAFIVGGIFLSVLVAWIVALLLFAGAMYLMPKYFK